MTEDRVPSIVISVRIFIFNLKKSKQNVDK